MVSTDTLKAFLSIGEGIKIHETPDGGWFGIEKKSTVDFSELITKAPQKSTVTLSPVYPINRTAMELVKLCNGTLAGEQILAKIASQYGEDITSAKEALEPFIKQAIELKHLRPTLNRNEVNLRITGTNEFFMPIHQSIELTTRCNFWCEYCYRNTQKASKTKITDYTMPSDQVIKMLEKLAKEGVWVVELTGGEPLLHPDIVKIIDYCGKNFNLCAILTNCTLVTEEIADALKEAGNFLVGISLDGPDEKLIDKLANYNGAYKKICNSMKLLTERELLIRAAMTVISENAELMEDTLLCAKDLGATIFSAAPIMSMGRASKTTSTSETLCHFIRTWSDLCERYPGFTSGNAERTMKFSEEKLGNCGAGHKGSVIAPNGNVRACLVNNQKWSIIGNIFNQSYRSIFSSPKVKFFRDLKWPDQDTCGECEDLWYCSNCAIRGVQSAIKRKDDCVWAQKQHIWDWILTDELAEDNIGSCSRAQAQK